MSQSYKFQGNGLNSAERKRAKRKFDKYCKIYNYEKINDLELLESLVFHEILINRVKQKIADLSKSKTVQDAEVVPKIWLERLTEMEDQTLKIREKLGLFEEKKTETPLKYIQTLQKKFKQWMANNSLSRQVTCPFCSKLFFLKIRTDKYEAYKSPFFNDKILLNRPLWDCYQKGKISIEECSAILGVSPDYFSWLEEKFFSKDSNQS